MGRSRETEGAREVGQGIRRGSWTRSHSLILGLFTLLALILSWPLVARFSGWVPGIPQWAFDEFTFVWNIWYFKQAVVERLASPLHTELIYYPLGIDLVLYTFNFFNALVALPLQLAGSLVVASNITLILSTALSGYGTFLLVRWLLGRDGRQGLTPPPNLTLAALIAGILYAFASNRAIYMALGHYDMVTTQWIPFYALMLLRSLDGRLALGRRYRAAALAGLFFAFSGLAEMILAVFLAIFTLIVVVITLVDRRRTVDNGRQQTVGSPEPIPDETRSSHPVTQSPNHLLSLLAALLILGATAFLVWSPVLAPILKQFLTADFSLKGWGEAIPLSTDLLGWFTPTVLHPLFGGDLVAELRRVQLKALSDAVPGFRDVNTVFLGWASLALALLGWLTHRRQVRIWSWTGLIFGLFTLGPFLQINGRYRFDLDGVETSFPLPYALLHYIPIVKANRAPNRNSVLLMLGLAVLAGYGAHWLLKKMAARSWKLEAGRRKAEGGETQSPNHPITRSSRLQSPVSGLRPSSILLASLLTFAILFEHLAVPLPLSDARVPAVYQQIAQDPAPVSVMQLPLGWRNSFGTFGPERTQLQYYQTVHRKPMIGGNISRAPDFKMDYFRRIPLFQALVEVQSSGQVDPSLRQAAQAQAEELVYLYNIGYVLLFPAIPQRFPYADTWQETWRLAWEILPLEHEPFWTGQGIRAYRTVQPPGADRFQLRLGEPGTFPYRGEGWDQAEADTIYDRPAIWATASQSCLFLPLRRIRADGSYQLRLQAHPFAYPGGPAQQVTARVNGQALETRTLTDGWQELTWTLPGSALVNSLNRVCLDWAHLAVPRQVVPGERIIGRTGVALPVDVDLKAFADGGFIALFDEEGRQQDGSAGRRGVNVTVLDPESGAILAREGFDTAANPFESEKLARFLATIPPGRPVLVVSKGEAWAHLTPEAVQALNGLGADLSLEAIQGRYFALVGVAGAQPGTALQAVDEQEAFLRVSLNRDRRSLAGAVSQVSISPAGE